MKAFKLVTIEVVLWALALFEIINDYMRILAALAATATFIFAIVKFIKDERERKQRTKLTELQIENELRQRDILIKQKEV